MPFFGQEWFIMAERTYGRRSAEYRAHLALCRRVTRQEGIDKVLDELRLDALVALTSGPAFVTDLANGDHAPELLTSLASTAGYPHVTVPAGFAYGLPIGVSFMGTAWSEPALLRFAYAFERLTNARRPPLFQPTAVFDR
jgi:amidase